MLKCLEKLMELSNLKNNIIITKNFLSKEECNKFISKAPKNIDATNLDWSQKTIDITNEPITQKIQNYWRNYFKNYKLTIFQSQIQLWPKKSYSDLHKHDAKNSGRRQTLWNSMLYLNDNYLGGEFYTKHLSFKPKTGMLTFFNGGDVYHGVKKTELNDRYTIIFWFN